MRRFILPVVIASSIALVSSWLGVGCASGDTANGSANSEGVGASVPVSGAGGAGGAANGSGSSAGGAGGKNASSSSHASGASSSSSNGAGGGSGKGGAGGGPCMPEPELCDGVDNNCNGVIDEGCACINKQTQDCYSANPATKGIGVCKTGTQTCDLYGAWSNCIGEVDPAPTEICNDLDDDCNGTVDDGLGTSTCGIGDCTSTTPNCVKGVPTTCAPLMPASPVDLCDGTDNNCNGLIDDGCSCIVGKQQSCYAGSPATLGVGVCTGGIESCVGGTWGACANQVLPSPEVCNGLDDDCNGAVDDTLGTSVCGVGACQMTAANCVAGMASTCVPGQPTPEECNGIDDDCNNLVDDGLGTISCGLGQCLNVVPACKNGKDNVCNPNAASAEICDGKDNNCNGVVDDGDPGGGGACDSGLQGICAAGTQHCLNGSIACVQNAQPSIEVCDGKDNDCNGVVDDNNPGGGNACNTGKLGVCAAGNTSCIAGAISCVQTTQSSTETCDGLDNNCNGATDEGNPGGNLTCDTGKLGLCSAGTTACTSGSISCNENVQAGPELCDGKDNNCNGQVDEGNPESGGVCTTGKPGVCSAGTTSCNNGSIGCVENVAPSAEVCDGKDNDCDGAIDNGNPGGGTACNTGKLGVCAAGTSACSGGAIVCNQNVQPSAETCDGKDNDCDGVVDNGNPGGNQLCGTGKLGICASGTTLCVGGMVACNQNALPAPETCNGLDDNCNGMTDEGNPGGGASCNTGKFGVCAPGTSACAAGILVCNQNVQPSVEVCDGQDNDCDNVIDNGNPGGNQSCNTGKLGICAPGMTACIGGMLDCNQNQLAAPEVCDNKDNDCDGVVDNGNPGGNQACSTGKSGVCAPGTTMCTAGAIACTENVATSAETCDGLDNNCDGVIDNVLFSEAIPNTCANASTKVLNIAPGTFTDVTGHIDGNGDDYFTADFTSVGDVGTAYHPEIFFESNPGTQFKLHVLSSCGATDACGAVDTFEVNYDDYVNNCQGAGDCADSITPRVTQWIIHVTRVVAMASTCSPYTVRIIAN